MLPSSRISYATGRDISGSTSYWTAVSIAEELTSLTVTARAKKYFKSLHSLCHFDEAGRYFCAPALLCKEASGYVMFRIVSIAVNISNGLIRHAVNVKLLYLQRLNRFLP